jgi:diguanylate cyclase (GGDEF)-like protein
MELQRLDAGSSSGTAISTRVADIRSFLRPGDPSYPAAKFGYYRRFNLIMVVVVSVVGALLWLWDRAIDPVGALATLPLRTAFPLVALPYIWALYRRIDHRTASFLAFTTGIGWQMLFILSVRQLEGGITGRPAIFLFFLLIPLLTMQGLPLPVVFAHLATLVGLPLVLAQAGLLDGLETAHYALLVVPSAVMLCPALLVTSLLFRRDFLDRRALERAASQDPLTGLSNRRHITASFAQERRRWQQRQGTLAAITLDIDRFKPINDRFGHDTGDRVIQTVASICRKGVRSSDLVGRMGGEEFAIILPGADLGTARARAEQLREEVQAARVMAGNGRAVRFTASFGVAEAEAGHGIEALLRMADGALYKAKQRGRNRVRAAGEGHPLFGFLFA